MTVKLFKGNSLRVWLCGFFSVALLASLTVPGSAAENQASTKALLVIDIQDAYINNYPTADTFIARVNQVIEQAAKQNFFIVYIRREDGGEIDKRVKVVSKNIICKSDRNGFTNPELDKLLKANQINELYLAGLDALYCVLETGRGGVSKGYIVTAVKDAMVTTDFRDFSNAYFSLGIWVITSDQLK